MRCQCRRKAVTSLRCSRCNVPICPDCSKMYSAGILCRTCVRGGKSSRLYELSPANFAKTFLVCLPVGIFTGWLLASLGGFGLMAALWGGLGHGLAVSEAGLRVSGRKLGWKIETLVGFCAANGLIVGWILTSMRSGGPFREILLAHLFSPWSWVALIIATVVAVGRFRNI